MISPSIKIQIDDKVLRDLQKNLAKVTSAHIDIGFLGGKSHKETPEITVAELATIHEFGTDDGSIPERPFMRQTFDKNRNYVELLRKETSLMMAGKPAKKSLVKMGETVRTDMVKEIGSGDFVPLAESTIEAKGSSKQLLDSGFLRNSIEYRIGK